MQCSCGFQPSRNYLIRINFRANSHAFRAEAQFVRDCAKISTKFLKFYAGVRKFIRAKIFKFRKILQYKNVVLAKYLREIARKLVLNFDVLFKVRENKSLPKFVRAKIYTNKVCIYRNQQKSFTGRIVEAEISISHQQSSKKLG